MRVHAGVQRGAFAGPGRAAAQHHAVRLVDQFLEPIPQPLAHARASADWRRRWTGRGCGATSSRRAACRCVATRKSICRPSRSARKLPSCGTALLRDVHGAQHLENVDDALAGRLVERLGRIHRPVDPDADAQLFLLRFEVHVGAAAEDGVVDQLLGGDVALAALDLLGAGGGVFVAGGAFAEERDRRAESRAPPSPPPVGMPRPTLAEPVVRHLREVTVGHHLAAVRDAGVSFKDVCRQRPPARAADTPARPSPATAGRAAPQPRDPAEHQQGRPELRPNLQLRGVVVRPCRSSPPTGRTPPTPTRAAAARSRTRPAGPARSPARSRRGAAGTRSDRPRARRTLLRRRHRPRRRLRRRRRPRRAGACPDRIAGQRRRGRTPRQQRRRRERQDAA